MDFEIQRDKYIVKPEITKPLKYEIFTEQLDLLKEVLPKVTDGRILFISLEKMNKSHIKQYITHVIRPLVSKKIPCEIQLDFSKHPDFKEISIKIKRYLNENFIRYDILENYRLIRYVSNH